MSSAVFLIDFSASGLTAVSSGIANRSISAPLACSVVTRQIGGCGPRPRSTAGFSLLSMTMAVGLFAYLSIALVPLFGKMQLAIYKTATVSGINELAQASKNYYIDPLNGLSWPESPGALEASGYLSGFQNRNGYGYPYTFAVSGHSLSISTQVASADQALLVASHFGGLATTSEAFVTVQWSAPGNDASHQLLVARDGSRDVFGDLEFRAGGEARILLNGNDIEEAGSVEVNQSLDVRNASGSGMISADNAIVDELTVDVLTVRSIQYVE